MLFKKVSENYVALGAATTHTMNLSREELDISNKDTGEYGDTELGQISWDIQAESMMIEADYDSLVDAFLSGEVLHVAFAVTAEAGSKTGKPSAGWTIGSTTSGNFPQNAEKPPKQAVSPLKLVGVR